MDAKTVLAHSAKTTFQIVADEAILIHMDSGAYFSLNEVGTEFWEMLPAGRTVAENAGIIAEKYDVDVVMVLADFMELGEKLLAEELVEVLGG